MKRIRLCVVYIICHNIHTIPDKHYVLYGFIKIEVNFISD